MNFQQQPQSNGNDSESEFSERSNGTNDEIDDEGAEQKVSDSEYDDNDDEKIEIIQEDIKLDPTYVPISQSELEDEDNELWLLRFPVHSLSKSLDGRTLRVDDNNDNDENVDRHVNERAGMLSEGYFFRDIGRNLTKGLRAGFVFNVGSDNDQEDEKQGQMQFVKPFSRAITVAFETGLSNLKHSGQMRTYPAPKPNLKLQFRTVGSKRGTSDLESVRKRRKLANAD